MKNQVVRFVKDESGATAIEYGLIAALIAVGIIAAARGLGSQIGATFNTVTTTMKLGANLLERRCRRAWGPFRGLHARGGRASRRTGWNGSCARGRQRLRALPCERSQDRDAMFEAAVLTVLPGAVAFAAAMDLLTMKIPNRISAVMVLAFFPLALLAGLDAWDIADHVAAGVLMLVLGRALVHPRLVRRRRRQADGGHRPVDRAG